ncbi:YhfT family protein [Actinomadura vinacea]|uniref:YhfT family protein n=1 Tax=Actinomadura vinacea TaxID=115336 RepID=UPI003CD0A426
MTCVPSRSCRRNDGVRPFLLDFIRGNTERGEMTAVSFGLSAGFVFGLGAPMAGPDLRRGLRRDRRVRTVGGRQRGA